MDFFLFVLLNAILFIRPSDVFPALLGLPIYNAVILVCLIVSLRTVSAQLTVRSLAERPISACVLGLLVAVLLSHLSHLNFEGALISVDQFIKVVLYYLLLVGAVDSSGRLSRLLDFLCGYIVVHSVLALLQYHDWIELEAFAPVPEPWFDEETGEDRVLYRLCGAGIFNNPNDISRILIIGMIICLYRFNDRRLGLLRTIWIAPFWLFGSALILTYSRGAFIALLAGLLAYLCTRFGRRSIPVVAVLLPILFVMFAGRQSDITSVDAGTGQQRIRIWSEGLEFIKRYPLFGIGMDNFANEASDRLSAHNSVLQCYAELGIYGGTLFIGAFYLAIAAMLRLRTCRALIDDPELWRMGPYILAMLASYLAGMLTSNRSYTLPTYMLLGLASAYTRIAEAHLPAPILRINGRLGCRLVLISLITLFSLYVFIARFLRWKS